MKNFTLIFYRSPKTLLSAVWAMKRSVRQLRSSKHQMREHISPVQFQRLGPLKPFCRLVVAQHFKTLSVLLFLSFVTCYMQLCFFSDRNSHHWSTRWRSWCEWTRWASGGCCILGRRRSWSPLARTTCHRRPCSSGGLLNPPAETDRRQVKATDWYSVNLPFLIVLWRPDEGRRCIHCSQSGCHHHRRSLWISRSSPTSRCWCRRCGRPQEGEPAGALRQWDHHLQEGHQTWKPRIRRKYALI